MTSELPGAAGMMPRGTMRKFADSLPVNTEDALYISRALVFDWLWNFCHDNKEYLEPRTLGVKAEYVEMHRKVMKLKGPLLDGVDTSGWREPPRKILMELISHAMLALVSMDQDSGITASESTFKITCMAGHEHTLRECWGIDNTWD